MLGSKSIAIPLVTLAQLVRPWKTLRKTASLDDAGEKTWTATGSKKTSRKEQ